MMRYLSRVIVAGTGHRPNKLGGYGKEAFDILVSIAEGWLKVNRPTGVISGMALGWDMALAQASINLGIPFVAAVPFKGRECKWPEQSQREYNRVINHAAKVIYVCEPGYAPYKMQKRNEWMVDRCNILLAMWDGTEGGTGNCISYANKKSTQIINLYNKLN